MDDKIKGLVETAKHIVVLQADNPDADSLGSAVALEQILGEMGKQISLYCAVDMPQYLHYVAGWDRVTKDFPAKYDLAIIVDASTRTLFESLQKNDQFKWLATRPLVIIDHHKQTDQRIDFASGEIIDPTVASSGEIIFNLAKHFGWPLDSISGEAILISVLGDTQGLTNDLARPSSYRLVAELLEMGVSRTGLEERRRQLSKMHQDIFRYKADLIKRSEFFIDGKLAFVSIPYNEITTYSPLYNPAPLIQADSLMVEGVGISVVIKCYPDRLTGSIRCNEDFAFAATLAEKFGGGGHPYAAGFKINGQYDLVEIKRQLINVAQELMGDNQSA